MACLSVVLLLVLHAEALVLPRARWACAASAHQERIANLLGAAPAAAVKRSGSDPLLNFVFNYYRADLGKPANLGLWTPAPARQERFGILAKFVDRGGVNRCRGLSGRSRVL